MPRRWRCNSSVRPAHLELQAGQRECVIQGRWRSGCSTQRRPDWMRPTKIFEDAADDGARMRVVIDQIASLPETRLERIAAEGTRSGLSR